MFEYNFRFYGRFVFVEQFGGTSERSHPTGAMRVLAVKMEFNPDVQAHAHRFVLVVPRNNFEPNGSRPPDGVFMSGVDIDGIRDAEHVFWNLNGQDVSIDGANTLAWPNRVSDGSVPEVPNLLELAGIRSVVTAVHDDAARVSGSVNVKQGAVSITQMIKEEHRFVAVKDPTTEVLSPKALGDIVSVAIRQDTVFVVRVRRCDGAGPETAIVLKSATALPSPEGKPIIATFSNLCARPHELVDTEYAGLYEVLKQPPLVRDRLVPSRRAALGGSFDCFKNAYIPLF